jgi:3'-phosphoadenosine 5'-phosphosulfate sulfotransferase (PAPS reductase)/FAD synthetase
MSQVVEEKKVKHIVGFSGGIDSQATARWVLNRYPKEDVILLNSDAGGNEHPITTEFIEKYSESIHPVVMVTPLIKDLGNRCLAGEGLERRQRYAEDDALTFDRLAEIKGRFPSSKMQFCTEHLKLKPQHRWIKEHVLDKGFAFNRYAGIRRQESKRRSNKQAVEWDDYYGCPLYHPIVDWTKQMCFDYCKYHGEEVNPLYTMGFKRVGCAPCVNSNKADILEWATRFPQMIDKVRGWEKRTGKAFFAPCVPGLDMNFVDQVVDWSKTSRGGKQYSLLVLQEPAACDSDYGLCE